VIFHYELAQIQQGLGNLRLQTGRPAEAATALEEARSILEAVIADDPTLVAAQSNLASCLSSLGVLRRRGGRSAEAAGLLRRALAIWENRPSPEPADHYCGAGCHAQLGILAGQPGSGLPASEGPAATERALQRLRQAIAGGWRDAATMRLDPALDPLRSSPE